MTHLIEQFCIKFILLFLFLVHLQLYIDKLNFFSPLIHFSFQLEEAKMVVASTEKELNVKHLIDLKSKRVNVSKAIESKFFIQDH